MNYRRNHINPKIRNLRPKKRIWKSPVFWLMVLVLIVAGGIFYLFFFYPKFQVKHIQISGNVKVDAQEIENLALEHVHQKILGFAHGSIFFVNTKNMAADILQTFPVIEKAEIKKDYFDSLNLNVTERNQIAVFCTRQTQEECFSIDASGIIFEPLKTLPGGIVVLTKEELHGEVLAGESMIDKKIMDAINNIQADLKNNFQIDIREAFVSNPLILRTSENWKLYFDPDGDIQAQITKMNLLLKDQITPSARKNLQYIYLQYKDRAYYK